MGTRVAPTYANIFIGKLEREIKLISFLAKKMPQNDQKCSILDLNNSFLIYFRENYGS